MANLFKSKVGWKIIKVGLFEMKVIIQGFGICDYCNKSMEEGNLILVLNQIYCDSCYNRFDNDSRYYAEDVSYENKVFEYYKSILKIVV